MTSFAPLVGAATMSIRTHAVYHGRVQGVCFRATSQEIASCLRVSGFVRNLPDGTVELEVQGEPDEVRRLLDSIAQHYESHIRDISTGPCELRADERGFRILQ